MFAFSDKEVVILGLYFFRFNHLKKPQFFCEHFLF